jgi:hypothetical protein
VLSIRCIFLPKQQTVKSCSYLFDGKPIQTWETSLSRKLFRSRNNSENFSKKES